MKARILPAPPEMVENRSDSEAKMRVDPLVKEAPYRNSLIFPVETVAIIMPYNGGAIL